MIEEPMLTPAQSLVLGAVIALASSLILEWARHRMADRRAKKLFKSLLKIEIPTICSNIDALVTSFNQLAILDVLNLLQIQSARQGYDRNRDWLILLPEGTLRDDLIRFYQRLLAAHQGALQIENFATLPVAQAAFVAARRANLIIEFRDIAVQGHSLVQRIDLL